MAATFFVPQDVLVAEKLEAGASTKEVPVTKIPDGWIIADIGPDTIREFSTEFKKCKTVVWNGPVGVFEVPEFANGTHSMIKVLADLEATTVIGGGSTGEAVIEMGLANKMSHVSTGGGALLPRLKELADLVNKYGKPWYTKMGSDKGDFESVNEGWYEQY